MGSGRCAGCSWAHVPGWFQSPRRGAVVQLAKISGQGGRRARLQHPPCLPGDASTGGGLRAEAHSRADNVPWGWPSPRRTSCSVHAVRLRIPSFAPRPPEIPSQAGREHHFALLGFAARAEHSAVQYAPSMLAMQKLHLGIRVSERVQWAPGISVCRVPTAFVSEERQLGATQVDGASPWSGGAGPSGIRLRAQLNPN